MFHMMKHFDQILLLYVNEPSVVIGRNQNPWKEINTKNALEEGVHVVRRISGGGTVYHDLGNINFSFIYNKGYSSVEDNFKVIKEAIASLGIDLDVTKRNDLFYRDKKVSGNAFYNRGTRHMHHGTLLIDTDTSDLWKILNFEHDKFIAKGVDSVKSPIINLKSLVSDLSVSKVFKALRESFDGEVIVDVEGLEDDYDYQAWSWVYGETPKFEFLGTDNLIVEDGKVVKINGVECHEMKFDEYVLKEVANVSRIV
jgi:lipoate-protein ligase A